MISCHEEIRHVKMRELLQREREYNFCEFLTLLRQTLGVTRRHMGKDIKISEHVIFNWESGNFQSAIKIHNLVTVADYFSVSMRLLQKKMIEYLEERKNENKI